MTKFRSLAVTAVALLTTISFAACSGGDEETPTAATFRNVTITASPSSVRLLRDWRTQVPWFFFQEGLGFC
ncbi:MAG: hypothetical protein EXR59_05155 [Dehalococcoidia bacterium]|nr:hypothetical protein [Dehalococcoidia bacterium]